MWPFSNKDKERADKLEAQLMKLVEAQEQEAERIAETEAIKQAEEDAANEVIRLAEEQRKREEAKKNLATEKGEPYINIVSIDMDQDKGATVGAIEMDWNVQFIEMLQKNGYVGVSDEDAVDQWFRDVCRHVVLETYEEADESGTISREQLDDGRAEYS